jgi:hypothetical protein
VIVCQVLDVYMSHMSLLTDIFCPKDDEIHHTGSQVIFVETSISLTISIVSRAGFCTPNNDVRRRLFSFLRFEINNAWLSCSQRVL